MLLRAVKHVSKFSDRILHTGLQQVLLNFCSGFQPYLWSYRKLKALSLAQLLYVNDLSVDAIGNGAIYANGVLPTLNIISIFIYGNNLSWPQALHRNWLPKYLYDNEKLYLFRSIIQIIQVLLIWKRIGLFLRENHLFKYHDRLLFLNWIGIFTSLLLLTLSVR